MTIRIVDTIASFLFFFICLFTDMGWTQSSSYYVSLRGMGSPRYKKDFPYFGYANPKAPKGGSLNLATLRRLDVSSSLEIGDRNLGQVDYTFATLMKMPRDNIEVGYPYLAESLCLDKNNRFVIFHLRKNTYFHNGDPITAADVKFSFDSLGEEGRWKSLYQNVARVEVMDSKTIKFVFLKEDFDLPYLLGMFPVFSHKSSLKEGHIPIGSGPYKLDVYQKGHRLVYRRIKDWWGENLPCNKGFYNFDEVSLTWYGTSHVGFEAFKKGLVDWWKEERIANWFTGYDFPAAAQGNIIRKAYKKPFVHGLTGLFINTRRFAFKDIRVRKALHLLFDFDWLNKARFFNQYKRNTSIFMDSEYGAFDKTALPNQNSHRDKIQEAISLLRQAGWIVEDGQLVHAETKVPLTLDLLVFAPGHVVLFQDFLRNLKRVGITGSIRGIDSASYMYSLRKRDFDLVLHFHPHVMIPGPEQEYFWASQASFNDSSLNLAGVQDPLVDDLVEKIKKTRKKRELKLHTALLDRLIKLGYYVIPGWAPEQNYVSYWKKINVLDQGASLYAPDAAWSRALEKENSK